MKANYLLFLPFLLLGCGAQQTDEPIRTKTVAPKPAYVEKRLLGSWDVYKDRNHTERASFELQFQSKDTVIFTSIQNGPELTAHYSFNRVTNSMFTSFEYEGETIIKHYNVHFINPNEIQLVLPQDDDTYYIVRKK
jgi:hypothetical protein